ncbi:hypothetical protein [Pseudomonas graminis]|uniref:hypothetical protein n=1 Tax=Pseudomonas graminis TaxID=158627 RepID=UPI0010618E65|nr:hypothetical protein [Pseudomonas graminis]
MNSKDLLESADFERFIKSGHFDRRTAEVIAKAKIVNGRLPIPLDVNSYNEEELPAIRSIIEFRANNLKSQGRVLNGATKCLQSLRDKDNSDRRAWVAMKIHENILIFIVNVRTYEIDGCMSLQIVEPD